MAIKFKKVEFERFTVVEFELDGGVIEVKELPELRAPEVDYQKGVILSGRGPVWLFATLAHAYHPALWVGCFDPRLGGGVVTQSHSPAIKVGDVIKPEST